MLERHLKTHDPAIWKGQGYVSWLRERGVERMTVQHVAEVSGKRVSDAEFILYWEGILVDLWTRTVSVADILRRWPDA